MATTLDVVDAKGKKTGSVDLEKGILLVKGAVPGARGRIVFVRNAVKGA